MSTFSQRQVHLVLELYKADGRINDWSCEAPNGTRIYTVSSRHLDGTQTFTKTKLVLFLKSIGAM